MMFRSLTKATVLVLLCGIASYCPAEGWYKPVCVSLGFYGGASSSYVTADSTMKQFFLPTTQKKSVTGAVLGLDAEVKAGKWLSFLTGMRFLRKGQNTGATKVFFQDDLFVHDFSSKVEFTYLEVPLVVKSGIEAHGFRLQVKLGLMPGVVVADTTYWVIDDQVSIPGSLRVPNVSISGWDAAFVAGAEFDYSWGRHCIFLAFDWEHGLHSIASGLPGSVYNRSAVGTAGYRFQIFKRP
jgi:hypothetical protein